ncbi:MAG TPA: hypothetical protein VGN72_08420 [Tepidisphaeraceae bacterium]|jgi:Fe-S-cluster containining protein|nr:hypothetical protein [Tepidisphaeraceae bacterium]
MELAEIVSTASRRPEVGAVVGQVYADLQGEIDARKPICSASGKCCRFEAYGHRLYVTTIELAAFVASLDRSGPTPWDGTGCPYQVKGLCSVHTVRPFGCRIFFCDPTASQWQNDQYETFHNRLKAEHERLGVPYRYVEWRAALGELGLSALAEGGSSFDSRASQTLHSLPARLASEGNTPTEADS